MPDCFNRHRDINRMYDVDEANTVLRKDNIVKESYELFEEIIGSSSIYQERKCFAQQSRGKTH